MATVEMIGVKKSFGDVEIFSGVDLSIRSGEFVVFVGPSGSGKSTLLRMIAGLETVSEGDVIIADKNVTFAEPSDRGIAMVFQSYALYPHMNVHENMAFNLRLSKLSNTDIEQRVTAAAKILRLQDLLDRSPAQLSGGQRQRVAIGRAIVRKPRVFLFDEPLSNLDASLRVNMRLEIERLHKELDATMIYVTHDQIEAMTLADRIVVIDDGEIQQVGPPLELYARPSNKFVASFIGSPKMNFFDAKVSATDESNNSTLSLNCDSNVTFSVVSDAVRVGDRVTIGLRPELIMVLDSTNLPSEKKAALPAKVETIERLGNINYGYFKIADKSRITVQIPGSTDLADDQEVALGLPSESIHLFDASGKSISLGANR